MNTFLHTCQKYLSERKSRLGIHFLPWEFDLRGRCPQTNLNFLKRIAKQEEVWCWCIFLLTLQKSLQELQKHLIVIEDFPAFETRHKTTIFISKSYVNLGPFFEFVYSRIFRLNLRLKAFWLVSNLSSSNLSKYCIFEHCSKILEWLSISKIKKLIPVT